MKISKLVLQYHLFAVGGIESYYIRMAEWAYSEGIHTYLIIDDQSKIDASWLDSLARFGVVIFYFSGIYPIYKVKGNKIISECFSKDDSILCISSSYETYFRGIWLKKHLSLKQMKNVLYIFHPFMGIISNNKIIDKYSFNSVVEKMLKANSIVYMDERTREYSFKHYNSLLVKKASIVRLGINAGCNVPNEVLQNKYCKKKKIILSLCRFEFPFKGYVIGLIEDFKKIAYLHDQAELLIIGDGDSRKLVSDTISKLDLNIQNRIRVKNNIEYSELSKLFNDIYINVGMGTTLLDAAKFSVPSIVAYSYDMSEKCLGFWSDDYTVLDGTKDKTYELQCKSFYDEIVKVLDMGQLEYVELCNKHRQLLVENYCIDTIMRELISKNVDEPEFQLLSVIVISLQYHLIVLKRKIKSRIKKLLPISIISILNKDK